MKGVLLVAHGGIPKDFPREEISDENKLRAWPRSETNDPYWAGIQKVGSALTKKLGSIPFAIAFNEFCSPTLEQAVMKLIKQGVTHLSILSTMIIPGGVHSEKDIPETVHTLQKKFPHIVFNYQWPYPLEALADFFAAHI